jgi:hypothetical protein
MRLILREYPDSANARINAIGQRKIDNSELSPKRNGWLCTPHGEVFKPLSPATSKDKCNGIAGKTADKAGRSWNCGLGNTFVGNHRLGT